MRIALLAFGNIDSRAGEPDDVADIVAQGFDMHIEPVDAETVFNSDFGSPRLTARERFLFQGDHGGADFRRENFVVGAPENILDGAAQQGIGDRRVAQITVLGEDGDVRAAQCGLVARKTRS